MWHIKNLYIYTNDTNYVKIIKGNIKHHTKHSLRGNIKYNINII